MNSEIDELVSKLAEKLSDVKERVIIIEVRQEGNNDKLDVMSEEVVWLRRTLIGIMISLLLLVAGIVVGAVII